MALITAIDRFEFILIFVFFYRGCLYYCNVAKKYSVNQFFKDEFARWKAFNMKSKGIELAS